MQRRRQHIFTRQDQDRRPHQTGSYGWRPKVQASPVPLLGKLIKEIGQAQLPSRKSLVDEVAAKITRCEYISSYNWIERRQVTIAIPGSPPVWTPLAEPRRLTEDSGKYWRDPNAAHCPKFPLKPAIQALLAEDKDLDTQSVDLFACSSTFGSLLRFVRQVDRPFRFFVQSVGSTVFFLRHENSPTEVIEDVRGYGHSFPEAYTTWDATVKGSSSHQRILKYDFGGIECLLRYECDGYLPKLAGTPNIDDKNDSQIPCPKEDGDIELLLNKMNVSDVEKVSKDGNSSSLTVDMAGTKIPQSAVFDLKTRSVRKLNINVLEEELPRFWATQTPNFILARHMSGTFNEIEVHGIADDIQAWESDNQTHLKQLRWLIKEIITAAQQKDNGKIEVCCANAKSLEIREQDTLNSPEVLPEELRERWKMGAVVLSDPSSGDIKGLKDINQDSDLDSADEEGEKDYTACSADECGYCGRCTY